MRAKYVLSEVLVGLWRNVTMTIAMMITMTLSLTTLGGAWLMYHKFEELKENYYAKVEVSIFLEKTVTATQRDDLGAALRADPLVAEVIYESKEQAHENFKELFRDTPALVEAVKADQLPESFRVRLKDPKQFRQISEKYQAFAGVDEIIDQQNLLGKIFKTLDGLRNLTFVVAIVMAAAAMLLVGNMIQVAAYSKRREVAVMKLVGASNWFIQAPFVLEAVVAGLVGAFLSLGLLSLAKWLLLDGVLDTLAELVGQVAWSDILLTFPLLAAAGALFSAVTAWVTLRFYLRV